MNIESVKVEGLHGFIDATLDFKKDLAIIVGINGSGKTSLLNLMSSVLKANLPEIAKTEFRDIQISGLHDGSKVTIGAKRSVDKLTLTYRAARKKAEKIELPMRQLILPEAMSRYSQERALRRYLSDFADNNVVGNIKASVKLTLVRIDRTVFAEDPAGAIAIDMPSGRSSIDEREIDPIVRVESEIRTRYTAYRNTLKDLNDQLTKRIALLLFEEESALSARHTTTKPITVAELDAVEESVRKSSLFPADAEGQEKVGVYFDAMRSQLTQLTQMARRNKDKVFAHFVFRSNRFAFARIRKVSAAFQSFDDEARKSFASLNSFLEVLNGFLRDSTKRAFYSDADYSLRFRLMQEDSKEGRPIAALSSGEKQIVTMLTYLTFLAGEDSIFIVDEPELSLHLGWQRELVGALKALRPPRSQLILATHSPEIIGPSRAQVIKLRPQYRPGTLV